MIPDTEIHNLVAGGAQLALIVTIAALLQWLVRVDAPGVRYLYWRAIAALCVALPWIQSYRQAGEPAAPFAAATAEVVTAAVTAAGGDPIGRIDWAAVAAIAIAAGAAARLLWIGAGLLELRRLRAGSAPGAASDLESDLQETLGTRADIRYVPHLQHPVTFGVRRPVVLLPDSLRSRPADIQRAVLAHELLHVQRRDWAWLVAEEIVRAALWFQPAAWWLISRIQLAREEVVDDLAVMVTGRRKVYVEALLAFSDSTSLVPTAAFARRRHLFRRIGLVSREVDMSSRRIVASCAFMAAIIAAGSWYAVAAFPLQHSMTFVPAPAQPDGPGPLEQRANPITPENPVPRRLTSENMAYPAEAAAVEASGEMTLQITLDEFGRVAEAREAGFRIAAPEFSVAMSTGSSRESLARTILRTASGRQVPVLEIRDAIVRAAADAVKQWRYDPPFNAPISFPVTFRFGSEPPSTSFAAGATWRHFSSSLPPVEMAFQVKPDRAPSSAGVVRVGDGGIGAPMKVKDVKPVYPPIAQAAGVQGIVVMDIRIEPDGTVGTATVVRSIPLLDGAALDAVKQWQFKPTLLNGQPVAVLMTVTINFALGQSESVAPASGSPDRADLAPAWAPDRSKADRSIDFLPSWSPDGKTLTFLSSRDGKAEWYVMNRDGSGLRKLASPQPR